MMVKADANAIREVAELVEKLPEELALILMLGAEWFDQEAYIFGYNAQVLETANHLHDALSNVRVNRNMDGEAYMRKWRGR